MPTAIVRRGSIERRVVLTGQVAARSELPVPAPAVTQARRIMVSAGSTVSAGQPLIETSAADRQQAADDARRRERLAAASAQQATAQIHQRLEQATEDVSRLGRSSLAADVQLAQSAVLQAQAGVQRADADLKALTAPPAPEDVRAADQQVRAAQLALQRAELERDRVLDGPDDADVAKAESEVASAERAVQQAVSPEGEAGPSADPVKVQAARRAVQVAQAALQVAQQPPPEVAAAQAMVVTARHRSPRERAAIQALARQQVEVALEKQRLEIERADADLTNAVRSLQALTREPTADEAESANRNVDTALRALAAAREKLAKLRAGPTQLEIDTAEAAVEGAHITLEQAQARRAALDAAPPSDRLAVARASVTNARAALAVAQQQATDLANLQDAQAEQLRQAQAQAALFQGIESGAIDSLEEAGKPGADPDVVEFARAQSALAAARQELANLGADTGPATIVAPVDGMISALRTEPGGEIGPDRPALTMIRAADLIVQAWLGTPESQAVAQGMPARVQVVGTPSTELSATVDRVADSSGARVADISVSWSSPLPPVGSEAQAVIVVDRRDSALLAPVGAVRREGNRSLADVVNGATVQSVEVTTGFTSGDEVEILNGLQEGQLVRTSP